jgi:Spy/CpxP family protein refolding chaperone
MPRLSRLRVTAPLAVSLALALAAAGAPAADAHAGRDVSVRRLLRDLDLTDAQKEQARAVVREAGPRLAPLRDGAARASQALFRAVTAPASDEAAVRAAAAEVARALESLSVERARLVADLRAILTPEQQAQLDRTLQDLGGRRERRGRPGARGGEPGVGAPGRAL